MSRYLLDTNILSALLKQPMGSVAQKLRQKIEHDDVCTSIIVACELRYGAYKKASPRLTTAIEKLLDLIDILPLDHGVDRQYAELRTKLESMGQPIGHNDLLIAAQACALNLILVTDNTREFSRIPGIQLENWLD